MFSDLVLRVRGDGRRYRIILQTPEFFDLTWFQLYSFPLFTRGGPYWQEVKVRDLAVNTQSLNSDGHSTNPHRDNASLQNNGKGNIFTASLSFSLPIASLSSPPTNFLHLISHLRETEN